MISRPNTAKRPRRPTAATLPALAALTALATLATLPTPTPAQLPHLEHGTVAAGLRLRQLDGVKRVLMIAAHPDDEDTSIIATLARGMGAETAYLSLSRGEGGQNLIGPRLREGLGIIRTGELLAARALDGGTQYFTRAFDFGYSKTLDESLRMWPLEEVLRDAVHVIRTFRPHVIVTVFSGTTRDGHGQHQHAGVVAREAFSAAADPNRFPELTALGASPWQPAKLYRSARYSPADATLRVPTGDFDPLLGRSPFQTAMESRSRHRSQAMGTARPPGPRASGLRLLASVAEGVDNDDGIFAGVDTTLAGQLGAPLPAGWPPDTERRVAEYRSHLARARESLPAAGTGANGAVAALARAAATLQSLAASAPPGHGRSLLERRVGQVAEALAAAAGVVAEVRASRDLLVPGESFVVDATVWNGGGLPLSGVRPTLLLPDGWTSTPTDESTQAPSRWRFSQAPAQAPADGRLAPGTIGRWSWRVTVPDGARLSSPYYLERERDGALYRWPDDPALWALPFGPAPVRARVDFHVDAGGTMAERAALSVERDGAFVGVDGADGEYRAAPLVAPPLNVEVDPPWMAWPLGSGGERRIEVTVTNFSASARQGVVRLEAPPGWEARPGAVPFALEPDGASATFAFAAAPGSGAAAGLHSFRAVAVEAAGAGGPPGAAPARGTATAQHSRHIDIIDHPHIRRALLHSEAAARVSAFPVAVAEGLRVGYVMGSGDDGPAALRQMGVAVEELGEARVRSGDFGDLDAIVVGVRAYETRPDLRAANEALLDFARAGGTVVVQYNRYGFAAGGFAPYPVEMRRPHDRVTDENAPVTVLAPGTPVFAGPNRIGDADFEGWVQERGLYFMAEWDERYVPVVEMADPGEEPKRGGLLVAETGDGLYVYAGLAFFRQWSAGVPGAYRLFANLVSLRAEEWRRSRGAPVSDGGPVSGGP